MTGMFHSTKTGTSSSADAIIQDIMNFCRDNPLENFNVSIQKTFMKVAIKP